ncbi:MAG TPA: protein kinase [Blastocatellia bacterium]|nr:protein kinase [Blastocatellia bacterium]
MTLSAGTKVSRYRVLSLLGAGGMGEAYLAEDTHLERKVALKLLPAQFTKDEERVRRFILEAKAASALNHPNIITIYEIGEAEAGRFIAMEFVQGRTLREMIGKSPSPEVLAAAGGQIAQALAVAHAAGITHRDIKPENIMVRDDGYAKVLDFGLARLAPLAASQSQVATLAQNTMPGTMLGTLAYMSPEQARGGAVTTATDIFALGIVFYELATGEHPFKADSLLGMLYRIGSHSPPPPSRLNPAIPASLDELIIRMLEKEADLRPAAEQVEKALAALAGGSSAGEVSHAAAPPAARHTVGRESERAELRAGFESTLSGRGLLVCVAGEPGIGKTTLVEDFLSQLTAQGRCTLAHGRCSERLAGTGAYLPLLEALESMLHSRSNPSAARLMKQIAPTWYAQVAPPSGEDEEAIRLINELRTASQEQMKRELGAFLQEVALLGPLVLFFDDLHWADVSTIDVLSFLARKFDSLNLLIVVTYRPSDLLLLKHPFLQIKRDLQARGSCRELTLEFLSQAEIAEYLDLAFPGHRFPSELPHLIHAKTEGSPLFMADLVRYLRDRKAIVQSNGDWTLAQGLPEIERELPESVKGMIERKIAQLGDEDHKLLVAASVQGYEFDSAVVAQVLKIAADEVEERLEKLDRIFAFVRLLSEKEFPNHTLTLRYRFVHVLYQNAFYASLRTTRLVKLSGEVAQALEGFYDKQCASVASELAVLWDEARDYKRAAEYLRLAAERATAQVDALERHLDSMD